MLTEMSLSKNNLLPSLDDDDNKTNSFPLVIVLIWGDYKARNGLGNLKFKRYRRGKNMKLR